VTDRLARRAVLGTVFAVDETALHDGPGLRMSVYLKGCPLRCVWCHSPESQRVEREVVWYSTRCRRCGACIDICPEGLRGWDPIDAEALERCLICERCVDICPADALEVKGRTMTAGEVVEKAIRLRPFFEASGGGVTLTGGEPTLQPEFCEAVLALLHEAGLHTALETTGLVSWSILARLVPVTDLFLYDLKHADDALHQRDTGVSNALILDNLGALVAAGAEVLVRVPCIPGHNATPASIAAIAAAARQRGVRRLELLPYNPATPGKYAWLRRDFPLAGTAVQTAAEMAARRAAAAGAGLEVVG